MWWDPEDRRRQGISTADSARRRSAARAVVVAWTPTSVVSRWVRGEAGGRRPRHPGPGALPGNAQLPIDLRADSLPPDLDGWSKGPEDPRRPASRARAIRSLLNGDRPGRRHRHGRRRRRARQAVDQKSAAVHQHQRQIRSRSISPTWDQRTSSPISRRSPPCLVIAATVRLHLQGQADQRAAAGPPVGRVLARLQRRSARRAQGRQLGADHLAQLLRRRRPAAYLGRALGPRPDRHPPLYRTRSPGPSSQPSSCAWRRPRKKAIAHRSGLDKSGSLRSSYLMARALLADRLGEPAGGDDPSASSGRSTSIRPMPGPGRSAARGARAIPGSSPPGSATYGWAASGASCELRPRPRRGPRRQGAGSSPGQWTLRRGRSRGSRSRCTKGGMDPESYETNGTPLPAGRSPPQAGYPEALK